MFKRKQSDNVKSAENATGQAMEPEVKFTTSATVRCGDKTCYSMRTGELCEHFEIKNEDTSSPIFYCRLYHRYPSHGLGSPEKPWGPVRCGECLTGEMLVARG